MSFSWQQIASPVVTEILCLSDTEGVVLDLEHGSFNRETIVSCIQVATNMNKKCFARLANGNPEYIRTCLDTGADGLIFANLKTAEESRAIHKISKHASGGFVGTRGVALVRQNHWGLKPLLSKGPVMIAQIESIEGVRNLPQIMKDDYDFYMLGPYDLSASCGTPGDFDGSEFKIQVEQFNSKIPEGKRAVHIPVDIEKHLNKYKNYGMIASGMDTILLLEGNRGIQNA
jgi:4-hydroxy-2-oxoheptanedioate aldolase